MSAEIDNAMPARKHVEPDDKIGLNLTADERDTILKDVRFLDDDYEQALTVLHGVCVQKPKSRATKEH